MASDRSIEDSWSRSLSQALRAIRRKRQLSALEVARRMGMPRRSYSHFESSGSPISPERILAFARATDSDAYAILLGVMIDAPALAVRMSDNKALGAFAILLREFDQDVGDDLARIETSTAISAFATALKTLAEAAAARRESAAQTWLTEELSKLGAADRGQKRD
jgi:transcriptional regulator with XRE-family HTH domain